MNQLKEKLQEFWKKVQKFFAKMYTETPNKEKNEESSWSVGDIFATFLRTLKLLWDVMIALFVCLFLFGAGIGIGYAASLFSNVKVPKTEELVQQVRNVSSVSKLTYSDKSLIAEVDSDLIRTPVAGDAISDNVKKAVIATEDENFESHKGVVPKAVLRATLGSVAGVGSSSGGSTLTQQLIKQQVVGDAPTFTRKATEIVDALALERG
ncbi:MAG: transglycosylase domain-containing protein, partial [Streptococcus parasanguinis]|nr:transglycosylase domain-containing protein [Streptococcus parasanguinis]